MSKPTKPCLPFILYFLECRNKIYNKSNEISFDENTKFTKELGLKWFELEKETREVKSHFISIFLIFGKQ